MRKPEYVSPTSLALWRKSPEEFYIRYLCETRLPREKQTGPMAVGSAFDAYVKSHLYQTLVGKGDPKYEFTTLFETQVEPHNRDVALIDGKHVFEAYKSYGPLADLLKEMQDCLSEPKFEIEIKGTISHNGREVSFLGRPDVFFMNKEGGHISIDWKVNGYYSKYGQSPMKGYVRIFPGLHGHIDCIPGYHHGMKINKLYTLDMLNEDWAAQLSIYSWLCGVDVGSDFIAGIDQISCNRAKAKNSIPDLRISQHRTLIDPDYQRKLFESSADVWETITSDHIFRDLSYEDSKARCQLLDARVKMLMSERTETDDDFMKLVNRRTF
jgi:hypothetical protein